MFILKTSLSLLLFFVSIIYFTIRKVNPLCEKNILFPGRSSQNHASWTSYIYWLTVRGGTPFGRPLRSPSRGIFNIEKGCHRVIAFFCIGIGLESGLMVSRMAFVDALFSRCSSTRNGSGTELSTTCLGDDTVVVAIAEIDGQA